jgi:predicted RNase H-like HicB family nuclease
MGQVESNHHRAYFVDWSIGMKIVVHEAEEGGFWAEVPVIPGCATQGETMDELMRNLHEALDGCLTVDAGS